MKKQYDHAFHPETTRMDKTAKTACNKPVTHRVAYIPERVTCPRCVKRGGKFPDLISWNCCEQGAKLLSFGVRSKRVGLRDSQRYVADVMPVDWCPWCGKKIEIPAKLIEAVTPPKGVGRRR